MIDRYSIAQGMYNMFDHRIVVPNLVAHHYIPVLIAAPPQGGAGRRPAEFDGGAGGPPGHHHGVLRVVFGREFGLLPESRKRSRYCWPDCRLPR